MLTASSLSAKMRRDGFLPVPRDYKREGVTVSRGPRPGNVAVGVFILSPRGERAAIAAVAEWLAEQPELIVDHDGGTSFYVSRKDST